MTATVLRDPGPLHPPARHGAPPGARPRLDSVDWLRGLVMVLMALDHTRDFFGDVSVNPVDPEKTNVPLFLTRWVTHFCAPTFVFLTGVGVFLSSTRGRSKPELSWFLVSRGLWIVFLEVTFVRLMWTGCTDLKALLDNWGGVLWAIGWSMVVLAGLIYLPRWLIFAAAVALIAGHNLFDSIDADVNSYGTPWAGVWKLLHVGASRGMDCRVVFWQFGDQPIAYGSGYPLIPWVGVMALGYAVGPVLKWERRRRVTTLVSAGAALTLAFLVVRGLNVYGDRVPWSYQDRGPEYTALSFLNCEKYPPSLDYLLMTLGPALLLLAAFDRPPGVVGRPLVTIGRVPLFFYLIHLPLIVGSAGVVMSFTYSEPWLQVMQNGGLKVPLWGVYLIWLAVVFILYWPCRWFAGVKRRNGGAWLSYL
jgi:uncharacterized membrane protein